MKESIDCLRQRIRKRRRQLGLGARSRAARCLAKSVLATDTYRYSRHIAFYLAVGGELDCRFLLKQAWRQGKYCYLPVLAAKGADSPLLFTLYRPGMLLQKNRYGILEPKGGAHLKPQALDLVVTPLVVCDGGGNRIGMGGGYYDRGFAFKKANQDRRKRVSPWLLGVAYRFQQIRALSPEPWDVRLDQTILV